MSQKPYAIIVIGAGAGGLVVAIGAARAGKSVLLIDKGTWGGDCTNFGCIPSKTLIASAENYASNQPLQEREQTSSIFTHVQNTVSKIRSHEEPSSLEKLGIKTLTGSAHFIDRHTIEVLETSGNTHTASGKKIVLACGSRPIIPDLPGLEETPFLTNETIFDLKEAPESLIILGGGPIGCELAQAFAHLGTTVSLIHKHPNLTPREEPEASDVLAAFLRKESTQLYLEGTPLSVSWKAPHFTLSLTSPSFQGEISAEKLLVATGRKPNLENLRLDAANVAFSKHGIDTDRYGRTSQKHIFAIGDVTKAPKFTHLAENQARAVLASLLLPFKKRLSKQPIPRVTYTNPEIASFGLLESAAIQKYGAKRIKTYTVPLSANDRAITAGREEGFVKIVTKKLSSRILGATIIAPRAGEMLPELSLAALYKIPLRRLASLIHPYPTYNLAIRKASDLWLTEVLLPKLRHPFKSLS